MQEVLPGSCAPSAGHVTPLRNLIPERQTVADPDQPPIRHAEQALRCMGKWHLESLATTRVVDSIEHAVCCKACLQACICAGSIADVDEYHLAAMAMSTWQAAAVEQQLT